MIVDRTPQENAAMGFQRPGLSFGAGRYNGYNPLYAGNQPAPGRAADWNWLSLHFSPMQSSLQSGAAINTTGQTFQNMRVFGLSLPDQPQGQILFPNAINQVTSSSSLIWDNANSIMKLASESALQIASLAQPFRVMTNHYVGSGGATDPAITIGYNVAAGGAASVSNPITPGVQQHQIALEASWNPSGTYDQVEFNHDYWSPDGLTHRRGFLMIIRNDTFDISWAFQGNTYGWYDNLGTTNKMRLDSSGFLGVNQNTPRQRTDFLDASNPQLRLSQTDNTVYTDFTTSSSGYLYIHPSGSRVGINQSSPTSALHVVDNGSLNLQLERTAATTGKWRLFVGGSGDFSIFDDKNAVTYLDMVGSAIIWGNSSFANTLTFELQTAANQQVGWGLYSASSIAWLIYRPASSTDMRFFDGSDRMTFKNGGDIIINGSTDRSVRLNIIESTNPQLRLSQADNSVYTNFAMDATGLLTITPTGGSTAAALKIANVRIGLYGATATAQYNTTGTTTGFTAGAGTTVDSAATFTGNTGTTAYTIGDIVKALKLIGIMAS